MYNNTVHKVMFTNMKCIFFSESKCSCEIKIKDSQTWLFKNVIVKWFESTCQ